MDEKFQVIQLQLFTQLPAKEDFIALFVAGGDVERAKIMYQRVGRPLPSMCYQFGNMFYFPKETHGNPNDRN